MMLVDQKNQRGHPPPGATSDPRALSGNKPNPNPPTNPPRPNKQIPEYTYGIPIPENPAVPGSTFYKPVEFTDPLPSVASGPSVNEQWNQNPYGTSSQYSDQSYSNSSQYSPYSTPDEYNVPPNYASSPQPQDFPSEERQQRSAQTAAPGNPQSQDSRLQRRQQPVQYTTSTSSRQSPNQQITYFETRDRGPTNDTYQTRKDPTKRRRQ